MLEDEVKDFLNRYACERYNVEDNLATIINKWREPYGVEFCKKFHYPDIDFVRKYKEEFEKYGVYVDRNDLVLTNEDVILFHCVATLNYRLPKRRYTVILYTQNVVTISAKDYAFIVCNKITDDNSVVVEKKNAAVVSLLT
jgi:hypothetical protein